MGSTCFVGVDLGQKQDHTGIAVVERVEKAGEWDPVVYAMRKVVEFDVRYLERVPLGRSYPEVVERVRRVVRWPALAGRCRLAVDATGVGQPVVDLLRKSDLGCGLMPVVITAGHRERRERGQYCVPKRDLIAGVQVMLGQGALKIAAGLEAGELLVREMADMRVKVTGEGWESYGAWREGSHDDLVLAVALACWAARKGYPPGLQGAAGYCRQEGNEPEGIKPGAGILTNVVKSDNMNPMRGMR